MTTATTERKPNRRFTDRRSSHRSAPGRAIKASLKQDGSCSPNAISVTVIDVSEYGLGIQTDVGVRPSRPAELLIDIDGDRRRFSVEVRRCSAVGLTRQTGVSQLIFQAGLEVLEPTISTLLESLQLDLSNQSPTEAT